MERDHQLYRAFDIWKRVTDELLIRYRCFELLSPYEEERGYCVQSADHYHGSDVSKYASFFEKQFLELLLEQKPDERSKVHKTVEEAINQFARDFKDS